MPGPVFLEGDSVTLNTIEEADVEFLQRTVNDPRVREGIAAAAPVNGPEERDWVASLGDDDSVRLLVCTDDDPVGTVGLDPPNDVWGVAEVGYFVAPEHWGNGYATDAVATLCDYAFAERRLEKVVATAFETNAASRRVLEKVGFTEEGVLRKEAFVDGARVDAHRYGLLAEEWSPR